MIAGGSLTDDNGTDAAPRAFSGDSVINRVFEKVEQHLHEIEEYRANCYLKGHFQIHKRNVLLRYIPSLFSFKKGVNEYLYESYSRIHYTAPNIYDRKIVAVTSTFNSPNGQLFDIMDYLKLNVYSQTLMENKVLSPFAQSSRSHYLYSIEPFSELNHTDTCYVIHVTPRYESTQLLSGVFYVRVQDYSIMRMRLGGKYNMIRFDLDMSFGESDYSRFLPQNFKLNLQFKFLNNHLEMQYTGHINYDKVRMNVNRMVQKKRNRYNLTQSYKLSSDTSSQHTDLNFFDRYRPLPLRDFEKQIYERAIKKEEMKALNTDSLLLVSKKKSKVLWGQVGDVLLNSYNIDMNKIGYINGSGFFNPVLFDYSHSRGISYQQVFKFNKVFSDDRLLRIVPKIGYNFTRKELYASINMDYYYLPSKQGVLNVYLSNENRIYSDLVINKMKEKGLAMPDDLSGTKWDYFKDVYCRISHQIEPVNGLNLYVGLDFHRRYLMHPPKTDEALQTEFNSFAPRVRLSWTPGMYYYMNGRRKINAFSYYPTFAVDYERGIRVFKNFGLYERVEFSMEQSIRFRNLNVLAYHLGGGMFTQRYKSYFVSYADFSNRYLPIGWSDDIGGSFQMLDGRWYNASSHYARLNATIESPFIILYPVSKILSFIQRERIYLGGLMMPGLNPYIEVGYGIGTHLFDAGVFVGNENGRFTGVGCKFTFELFNK